jgi:hypothetical protein
MMQLACYVSNSICLIKHSSSITHLFARICGLRPLLCSNN